MNFCRESCALSASRSLKSFRESSNVAFMKRMLCLTSVLLALQLPNFAQNATSASAQIERQDDEERYKRMSADMESLAAANASLQKKINILEERLSKVTDDLAKANNNSSVRDDLKVLRDKIQDVDKKREADKQFISDKIEKIIPEVEKLVAKSQSSRPTRVERAPEKEKEKTAATEAPVTEKGYSYTIQDGDTLSAIVLAYNKKFVSEGMKKISQSQVQAANPSVNWNRLRVGQKIVVPAPAS
jgi:uncharacterized protein YlxW (UPF0749 family)